MSFSVSYVYKIIDKFTPKLREIEKATNSFNRSIKGMENRLTGVNKAMKDAAPAADQVARSLKRVNQVQKQTSMGFAGRFQQSMKKAGDRLETFATSAGGFAASLGAGLALKSTMGAAVDLESSVIDLTKIFDFASADSLKAFQDELAVVAKNAGQSRVAMNQLAYTAGKLGIAKEDIGAFADLAGKVAVAFKLPMQEATDSLADMKVKLGLSQQELAKTLDTINYLDDQSNASGKGMLNIMSRLSGIFKAMSVPPEVAASFAAVAEQLSPMGRPELGASGLRMFIAGLQDVKKVSPEVGEALNKDFAGTIDKVLTKLRAMPDAARNVTIREVFGDEAAPFIMNLVTSQELLNKTLGIGADKLKAYGSMQREFNRQKESSAFKIQQFKAAMTDMAAEVGTASLPALKALAEKLASIATALGGFATANPAMAQFLTWTAAVVAISAPVALALSAMITGINGIATALMFLVATPVGATITGIALIAIGIYTAYQKSETFRNSITKLGRALKNIGLAIANPLSGINYLARDVNYDYDENNRKIVDPAYAKMSSSGFEDFMKGSMLSLSKEQNISISGSLDVYGKDGAKATSPKFNVTGANLGLNLAGGK